MRRRLLVLSAAALLGSVLLPATAPADVGRFIPGEAVDGPVTALGDLDVARDGTGAVAYVSRGGADHMYVSRLEDGALQPPERSTATCGASSQPAVAAGDGGSIAVVFVWGGAL